MHKILPTLVCVLLSGALFAQVSFTSQNVPAQGQYKKCVVDMNGDYLDDIVSVSSNNINILFQNEDGGFTAQDFPTSNATYLPGWSIAAGDLTGNGYNDLLYGSSNGVTFMIANDDGTAYTENSGPDYVFSQRSNFIDINSDGHLDAFVCHDLAPNVYYINDGNGNLTFNQGGLGDFPSGGNYGSIWVDYNNDGLEDMFLAKCGGEPERRTNQFFRNNGDGTFTNVAEETGLNSTGEHWSAAWGDFNNDGWMDAMVGLNSYWGDEGEHELMKNNGDGTFDNVTVGSGIDTFVGTSAEHLAHDFNNDGYIDILGKNAILINNGDMTFTEVSVPFSEAVIGDLNNDGFLDAYINGNVYFNDGNGNNWVVISTQGVESNRNGIGARVEITTAMGTQIRDVRSGEGFAYMGTLNTHFGIGTNTEIESIIIKWPSGIVDVIEDPDINTFHHFVEGENLSTDQQQLALVFIYPNPTNSQLHITSKTPVIGATASVYDVSGRMVMADILQTNSLNVSTLSTGMYFLNLDIDGQKVKLQFIKK